MNIKIIIYMVIFFITLFSMQGLDLNKIFKQGRVIEARILYLFIIISITYLVSNFLYDFMYSY